MTAAPLFDGSQACYGMDTDVFFPEEAGTAGQRLTEAAKAVCAGCGVKDQCLAYALPRATVHGIWGGTTGKERREIRKRLRIPLVKVKEPAGCGTTGGYARHYRNGEATCGPCKAAWNRYKQARKSA